ncbi:hypothetical protein [Desulfosporosinus fructosivorans]
MHRLITILNIFLLLLLATPLYAGSSFQYIRQIQSDNLIGYKSVVLDKDVYAHSNQLADLRVLNDQDEEVPYVIASVQDASTETAKASFILLEEAQYVSTQEGTDTIITIQANHLNAFRLELITNDTIERTYGLFGVTDQSTHYLSEGELSNLPPSDSSMKKAIDWTNTPPVDKLRLIVHNRDAKPIILNSINVKYYLTKLVYKDLGNSEYRLAYGNDTLRSAIYDVPVNKAIINKEVITQSTLGAEISAPTIATPPKTFSNHKLLFIIPSLVVIFLLILGVRRKIKKTD